MDAFEQLVSEILWLKGFWVKTSVKVELTKEEKRLIERRSSPRWELDIVAYSGRENVLRVVECKSYLDSFGVQSRGFDGSDPKDAKRYKLFNEPTLREVIFNRLRLQFHQSGACPKNPDIKLCLACGKIKESSRAWLRDHFKTSGWDLWDESWLKANLRQMEKGGYENQVSAVVTKLLLRGEIEE
jgi:hypothetical protein